MRVFPLFFCVALLLPKASLGQEPDLVLAGELNGDEHHHTYQELPFEVPGGLSSLSIEFEYDRGQRATIDLGLRDPEGFRGWSGGNKAQFTVGRRASTPSYLAGPIQAGTWHLLLGVPNLRVGTKSQFKATVWFERAESVSSEEQTAPGAVYDSQKVLLDRPGWYRGDLHLHSGHSDGVCADREGVRTPCPPPRTLDVARSRGLDFVALTEHNTTSHHAELAALQGSYVDLLLLPGREITTFYGHANVYGVTDFLEFRLGGEKLPSIEHLLEQVEAAGGMISINHPGLPSGELCMGCGWSFANTPYHRFHAVEVINGGAMKNQRNRMEGPLSGIPFWTERLNEGLALTAIGGSDNHDPDVSGEAASAIGRPVTVVYAEELSAAGVLRGLKSGRAFVDLGDLAGRTLDYSVESDGASASMGGRLAVTTDATIRVVVAVENGRGLVASIVSNRVALAPKSKPGQVVRSERGMLRFEGRLQPAEKGEPSQGAPWLRVELRDAAGNLVVLGNPVAIEDAR